MIMKNKKLKIIAGPCSVDSKNMEEIRRIAHMQVGPNKAVWGIRVVGLKSRTNYEDDKNKMGVDLDYFNEMRKYITDYFSIKFGVEYEFFIEPKTISYFVELLKTTHVMIAFEVIDPIMQLRKYMDGFDGRLFIWNPAVNQLGWPIAIMGEFARKHDWWIGLKNGKWLGEKLELAESDDYQGETSLEKTWKGLATYANHPAKTVYIQRGVDVPEKGNYRNYPIHKTAARVKKSTGTMMFFDPSHTCGPKLRDKIVEETISAMQIKISDDEYLYDGVLIEVGTSKTDTDQHISLDDFRYLIKELAVFRDLDALEIDI